MATTESEPDAAPTPPAKRTKRGVPEGLWKRCPGCQATIFRKEAEKRLNVCPECDYHFRVDARTRIKQLNDPGTFEEFLADLESSDPLEFTDRIPYKQRLQEVKGKWRAQLSLPSADRIAEFSLRPADEEGRVCEPAVTVTRAPIS